MKKIIAKILAMFICFNFAYSKPKNIILILSDDVGLECFSLYGGQDYKTPNFDKLAQEGVMFENCYSHPVCTPSRVKIMTGKANFRNYNNFGKLKEDQKTFANMLKSAGYKTAIVGKWQLGYQKVYPDCPEKFGFDQYLLWHFDGVKPRYWNAQYFKNGKVLECNEKFGPDVLADYACDYINENKDSDQPFFLYYPMVLGHYPFVPTPDSSKKLKDAYQALKKKQKDPNYEVGFQNPDMAKKAFVDMVAYMDKNIGKIYNTVKQAGILDDTVIIYTSDNGTYSKIKSNYKSMLIEGGKETLLNTGTHVPMLFIDSDAKKGYISNDLIDFSDFYPTFAEIASVNLDVDKEKIDGRSFYSSTKGKSDNPRKWIVCQDTPLNRDCTGDRTVRTVDYKLYEDGKFYRPADDLLEQNPIENPEQIEDYKILKDALSKLPPLDRRDFKTILKNKDKFKNYPNWQLIY